MNVNYPHDFHETESDSLYCRKCGKQERIVGNMTSVAEGCPFPYPGEREAIKFVIPLGSWDLTSGKWHPNDALEMSSDEQYAHNVRHGFIKEDENVR